TRRLQGHCDLRGKHASHQFREVVPRDSNRLAPTHPNIATECSPHPQAYDSALPPLRAALRSPLTRDGSNRVGNLAGRTENICKWFPSADTTADPRLAGVLRLHDRYRTLRN